MTLPRPDASYAAAAEYHREIVAAPRILEKWTPMDVRLTSGRYSI